jgi:nicotinate-nucleotide adenylyltransferase
LVAKATKDRKRGGGVKIALFGGTFDPIHWGHLLMAEEARQAYHLDRVIFIPSGIPPLKSAPEASAAHRLAMVRLAIRSNPGFAVSDWEIYQRRVVYTVETLAHFQRQAPHKKLYFIVGSDSLKGLSRWRCGTNLLSRCTFLVVERPGTTWSSLPRALRRGSRRVPAVPVPLASHDIRRCLHRRQSIRYQVPDAVERYIRRHRLYAS